MKTRKTLFYQELQTEVINLLKQFLPDSKVFNNNLMLIKNLLANKSSSRILTRERVY